MLYFWCVQKYVNQTWTDSNSWPGSSHETILKHWLVGCSSQQGGVTGQSRAFWSKTAKALFRIRPLSFTCSFTSCYNNTDDGVVGGCQQCVSYRAAFTTTTSYHHLLACAVFWAVHKHERESKCGFASCLPWELSARFIMRPRQTCLKRLALS